MASGASLSASGLSCHAATKNKATAASVKNHANCSESAPDAKARCFVRGFSRSYRRSTMRFMVMAAERAATMATTIQTNWRSVGQPFGGWCVARAASSAPVSAKGSAKTECSNLIISSTVANLLACCEPVVAIGPPSTRSSVRKIDKVVLPVFPVYKCKKLFRCRKFQGVRLESKSSFWLARRGAYRLVDVWLPLGIRLSDKTCGDET